MWVQTSCCHSRDSRIQVLLEVEEEVVAEEEEEAGVAVVAEVAEEEEAQEDLQDEEGEDHQGEDLAEVEDAAFRLEEEGDGAVSKVMSVIISICFTAVFPCRTK
mmetsp:Transcript_7871/g.14575  ORF Transcript_7871/g.14575 Transcript_7871/m.14575 type:complete len:104 (-) Transcript_7871:668-979(-)